MTKPISHFVKRPGRRRGDPDVAIPVPQDLATVPGAPQRREDVAFFSREHPLQTQSIDKSADRQWAWETQPKDLTAFRVVQDARMEPMYAAALESADVAVCCAKAGMQVLSADLMARCATLVAAADVNAVPPAGVEGLAATDDGAALPSGVLGIGALAIGGVKYRVQRGLLERMMRADRAVALDLTDAFELARETVSS